MIRLQKQRESLIRLVTRVLPLQDLSAVIRETVETTRELLNADHVLMVRDEGEGHLTVQARCPEAGPEAEAFPYSRSVIQECLQERKPIRFERNLQGEKDAVRDSIYRLKIWSIICIPLILPRTGQIEGVLYVDRRVEHQPFDDADVEILESFASLVSIALENAHLFEKATFDGLTSVYTRAFGIQRLGEEYERAKRDRIPLSVVMVDLDRFKELNDTYGHSMGDKVLQAMASFLKEKIRPYDFVVRLGGDEFLVCLPGMNTQEVRKRGTQWVREFPDYLRERVGVRGHMSLGGLTWPDIETPSVDALIRRVDMALYRAKGQGGGCAYFYASSSGPQFSVSGAFDKIEAPERFAITLYTDEIVYRFRHIRRLLQECEEHMARVEERLNFMMHPERAPDPVRWREIVKAWRAIAPLYQSNHHRQETLKVWLDSEMAKRFWSMLRSLVNGQNDQ